MTSSTHIDFTMNKKPLCSAPFRNKGTFFKEDGASKYTPCCYRRIPALNAEHWQDPEITELRKGLAGLAPIHPSCEECLSYGSLSTARLYDAPRSTFADFNFDPITGTCEEQHLSSSIFIGSKCNLGCRMCSGFVSNTYNYTHPDLSNKCLKVTANGYDTTVQNGVSNVCIAGGEPLLIDVTKDIMSEVVEKSGCSFIITNGAVPLDNNEIYKSIKKYKNYSYIMVSLDGDWETHAWIRCGIDIELLKENIKTMHEDGVLKGFNTVVSSMNYDKLLFPIKYADELNIDIDMTFLNSPEFFSCKHVPLEKRRAAAMELLEYIKYSTTSGKNKQRILRVISGLVELEYVGEVRDNADYIYLTRDI